MKKKQKKHFMFESRKKFVYFQTQLKKTWQTNHKLKQLHKEQEQDCFLTISHFIYFLFKDFK